MELIDKSALVAEIERRIKEYNTPVDRLGSNNIRLHECKDILSFINTLEVKDVDLDKEARHYLLHEHESPLVTILHEVDLRIEMQYHKDIENAFKAGFKIGLKARKEKEV